MVGEALGEALLRAIATIEVERVAYAIFGGLAANAWGRIRHTLDGDLLVFCPKDTLAILVDRLRDAGFSHHDGSDRFTVEDIEIRRLWFPLRLLGVSVKIDLVQSDSELYAEILKRRTQRALLGKDLWTVSLEDLILLKLSAGRPVDQVDALELLRLHLATVDRGYLNRWARRLGLGQALTDLLSRAAAQEPPF